MCVSPLEGHKTISSVGSKVVLPCNVSLSKLQQLTWKMNGVPLHSLIQQHHTYTSNDAVRLNIKMSESESEQYALVMKQVQTSHGGNYTCEVTTDNGTQEFMWELIVTGVLVSLELQEIKVIPVTTSEKKVTECGIGQQSQ